VSVDRLFAIVIALAVLFAPAMATAAMADGAPTGHMQMMDNGGHCHMPSGGSSDHHKSDGKSCCMSMCMALAVQPQSTAVGDRLPRSPAHFSAPPARLAYLGEIATPPPRRS
jgi:hypothetical protein